MGTSPAKPDNKCHDIQLRRTYAFSDDPTNPTNQTAVCPLRYIVPFWWKTSVGGKYLESMAYAFLHAQGRRNSIMFPNVHSISRMKC